MAHFAQIQDGKVVSVIVVANETLNHAPFPESEAAGQAFLASIGIAGLWLQTSYNTHYVYEYEFDDSDPPQVISSTLVGSAHSAGGTPFRGTYAGIGYIYDAATDTFTPPPPPEPLDDTVA